MVAAGGGWWVVHDQIWKSEQPFVFDYVILMKTLGMRQAKVIRFRIIRQLDLW